MATKTEKKTGKTHNVPLQHLYHPQPPSQLNTQKPAQQDIFEPNRYSRGK